MRDYLREPVILIFWLIGAAFLLSGLVVGWQTHQVSNWPTVSAKVINSQVIKDSDGKYVGQVEFEVADAPHVTLTTSWGSSSMTLMQSEIDWMKTGSTILLPNNPRKSSDFRFPPRASDALIPGVLALAGLLFAAIPIGVVALSQRQDAFKIAGQIFSAIGFITIGVSGLLTFEKVDVLRNWPQTEATVVTAKVGERPSRRQSLAGLDLVIRYTVDQQTIEAAIYSRGGTSDRAWLERQLSERMAPGKTITIRYQPSNPRLATFEADWSFSYFWECALTLIIGLMTACLGLAVTKVFGKPS